MSSFNSFKEIYIDFERLGSIKQEEINYANTGEFKVRQSLNVSPDKRIGSKGLTVSLPNYIVFGAIEENSLVLTITKIVNQQGQQANLDQQPSSDPSSVKNFIKKYKIIFTDIIIQNISAIVTSDENFILTIFTIDGQIKQLEFEGLKKVYTATGSFNRNLNIINSEYLNFYNSNFFALGSANGSIYLVKIENDQNNKSILHCDFIDEIKAGSKNFGERISSLIPVNLNLNNLFFNKSVSPDSIVSIKHLGNNLLAYTTEQFNFKIYNYKRKKIIYSNCLIKNRTDEILAASKINFMNLELTEEDVRETRSKCLIFTIYLEYNLIHVIQSFELWFINIPDIRYDVITQDFTAKATSNPLLIKNFETFYNFIDLGNDIRIKNMRVYKLPGNLIDMVNYGKKIWIISENPGFYEETGETSTQDLSKYDLKIFAINEETNRPDQLNKIVENSQQDLDLRDGLSSYSSGNSVIFLDSKIKNLINIINQIKLTKKISKDIHSPSDTDILFLVLTNEDLIPSELLISFFNKNFSPSEYFTNEGYTLSKYNSNILKKDSKMLITLPSSGQKFANKSQIIQYLQKLHQNIIYTDSSTGHERFSDMVETILDSLIKENIENEIYSLGEFKTKEIEGFALVRKYGISFLKSMSEFQRMNNIINHHEYVVRNMIFESSNLVKYQTHNSIFLSELQSKILHYITLEARECPENITYILFALLRIYLSEINLYLNDEKYLMNYFSEKGNRGTFKGFFSNYLFNDTNKFEKFVYEHFKANLFNQYSDLSFLDIFHEIIYKTFLNNFTFIEEHISVMLGKYENYKKDRRDSTVDLFKSCAENVKRSRVNANIKSIIPSEKFNSKFCEILSKLTSDKISSFFNISRDLVSFVSWVENYIKRDSGVRFETVKEPVEKMFIECYSCYLLANHRCKLNLKDSSAIEQICLIEKGDGSILPVQDIEVNYVDLTIYENLANFGGKIFHEIHNEYIDFIMLMIWGDLTYERESFTGFGGEYQLNQLETYTNFMLNDPNRKRRYHQFGKLMKMKEYKLISLLLALQNVNNLENIYMDIISQAYINDQESISKMKDLINKYFSMILDISNRTDKTGMREFAIFEDFYKIFDSQIGKNKNDPEKNDLKIQNQNFNENYILSIPSSFIITGYYFLEEQLNSILSQEFKYEFYFHCYSFIYPTLTQSSYILFKSMGSRKDNKYHPSNNQIKIIEEFLVNMLKSCIEIDIELALGCYSTIRDNFKKLGSLPQVVELFIDYLIKNRSNGSLKLISQETELIESLCKNLEEKCKTFKNNSNLVNLLKETCNLEVDSVIYQDSSILGQGNLQILQNTNLYVEKEKPINYFQMLYTIYSHLKDYQSAAHVCYSYSQAIQTVLDLNLLKVHDLSKVYREKHITLVNLLHCITKCEDQAASTPYFLVKEFSNNEFVIQYITLSDLEKEITLISIKIDILKFLSENEQNIQVDNSKSGENGQSAISELKTEEVNKIKTTNSMLNFIFKFRLFSILIDYNLIGGGLLDDSTGKKVVVNFIKANLLESGTEKLSFSKKEQSPLFNNMYGHLLNNFFQQIVFSNNITYLVTAIECLLYLNNTLELPDYLTNEMKTKNPLGLMEIYLKYSRFDNFVDIVVYLIQKESHVPKHIADIAYTHLQKQNVKENAKKMEILKIILQ